jgi:hypothetical protein
VEAGASASTASAHEGLGRLGVSGVEGRLGGTTSTVARCSSRRPAGSVMSVPARVVRLRNGLRPSRFIVRCNSYAMGGAIQAEICSEEILCAIALSVQSTKLD